ncbi:unnamed protein product [Lactuca virosa]|uniref:Ubiquitin-like domain-containing protein n=1 Tax=Lactuca virosa TaxID=75947 RepID=A0AAU9LPR6_9ASTR|nr:unnamed protein product [Lactuca virosa]
MEGGGEANDGGGAITDGLEVDGSDIVDINIRCSGTKFVVHVRLDSSVESFKSVIAKHYDVHAEQQRLIYKGCLLKDDQTLQSYGILLSSSLVLCMFTCLLIMNDIVI